MPLPAARRAHAKLNLVLSVGPPQPADAPKPGWHEIASWMHAIDLYDTVEVECLGGPTLRGGSATITWVADALRPTPIDWPLEKDLAVRAHALLEQHVGRSLPAHIRVTKRIPTGSGLGGGSSDAAATLLALRDAFNLDLDLAALRTLGATLGSDAPFFLDDHSPPRPALVTGFGESIERTPRAKATAILVIPPFSCPTPAVYKAYDAVLEENYRERELDFVRANGARATEGRSPGRPPEPHRAKPELVRRRIERQTHKPDPGHLFNDLAPAAYRVEPRLGELVTHLSRITRTPAHVTGSGSGIFILTSRPEKTLEQAQRVLPEGTATRICTLC